MPERLFLRQLPRLHRVAGGVFFLFTVVAAAKDATPAMDFVPPAPGTYALQRIQRATDGEVLDATGKRRRLAQFTHGTVTLLSFIYTNCSDAGGCPHAFLVLHQVKRTFESLPAAHGRVRIVSLSFDPERDTPQMMALYGGDHARDYRGVRWDFLTTVSARQLLPIVDGFGQDVAQGVDAATGRPTGRFAHVLKVFLIDVRGIVREIYATDYLLPEVVTNDVKTLLMEQGVRLQ